MTPSRVPLVVCVSSFDAGGTERQMVELVRGLDSTTYEVHAACFAARGPWMPVVEASAASIVEFPIAGFDRPVTWRLIRQFAGWCREHRIQAVLTSDFYTNVFGLLGAALAGVPVRIGGRRELVTDKTPAKLLLQRAAYATAHQIVTNSRAGAGQLRSEGVPARRIQIVHNGIDLRPFSPRTERRRIRRVVTVANLRAEKGHAVLIDAIAAQGAEWPQLEFQFVGDGPCRAALEQRAGARGVAHRIQWLGERHDIPALLAGADLFVLPTLTEAFPNSVMEAMAASLPVVATSVGGIPELVEDGVSGLLVAPKDPAALAGAIGALVADGERAEAFGRAARRNVESCFSTAGMVAGFSRIISTELQRRAAAARGRHASLAAPPQGHV
jgi:hypothetical protein